MLLLQLCSRPSILLISSTIWCRFWLISAPLLSESHRRKNRRENCSSAPSQSGCVHLGSIKRAKYATNRHIRDTGSDYIMKKLSRCWLGTAPRYWKVVASCFQIVSFAENTSAPLAPRVCIFQPILLLFFCFLALEFVYNTVYRIFFIPSQNLVAFKRKQNLLKKGSFRTFSKI